MINEQAIGWIFDQLKKAESQHPGWPSDPIHAAAILAEEAGECVQATIDFVYAGKDIQEAALEAAQCGAMAIRFLLHITEYQRPEIVQVPETGIPVTEAKA